MSKVEEIEQIIEQLSPEDFKKLSAWIEDRRRVQSASNSYPQSHAETIVIRDHSAFLNSYAPGDDGLYDDAAGR